MRKVILFFIFISGLFCMSVNAQTTKAADKLYAQGVTYMKTMTVASQKKAIVSFEKAKVAYDSKSKKNLCDQQIAACNNIIRKLTAPKPKPEVVESNLDVVADTTIIIETPEIPEVSLHINPNSIDVPAKGGKYVEISVECNFEEWTVQYCPDWISCTTSSNKILLKPERNREKSERAGVLVVVCKDKKAELIVKQAKPGFLGRLRVL